LRISTEWFGKNVACPQCKQTFTVASVIASDTVNLANSDTAVLTPETIPVAGSRSPTNQPSRSTLTGELSLGRYSLKGKLGEGGFGLVYLARDEDLARDVAIKLPRNTKGKSYAPLTDQAKERFLKEARAAAKLRHPNIVAVFDRGKTDEDIYIVYEFVPGRTLEALIAEKSIDLPRSIQLVASLADALSYASAENIIHRDIKPANIMIDSRNRPQIMDFGLAEALSEGMASSGGRIAGTPAYMSPEQARGEQKIGPATDQYSLGAILYELTTHSKSVLSHGRAAIHEVANRNTAPLEPLSKLPEDLRCIILKAMNSVAAQRYRDCADFADDLRAYTGVLPVAANPVGPIGRLKKWAQRNRLTALASVVSLLLLVTIAAVSSIAAVLLQQRERMLSSALATMRIAQEQAEANAAEAEQQRQFANQKTKAAQISQSLAEEQKRIADEQKTIAETALANEIEAQRQREIAEKMAGDESRLRKLADRDAGSARDALQLESDKNLVLQYAELLSKAAVEVRRGELSAAKMLLSSCKVDQRGWEWHWLSRSTVGDASYTRLPSLSQSALESFQLPPTLASRNEYQVYDAAKGGTKATYSGVDPTVVLLSSNRATGAFLEQAPSVSIFKKIDFNLQSTIAVTDSVVATSFKLLHEGRYIGFTVSRIEGRDAKNKPTPPQSTGEIWEINPLPRQMIKVNVQSGWISSFEFLAERFACIYAPDPSTLRVQSLHDGKILQTVELEFEVRRGPNSISRLADGRIAVCDKVNRFHYIEPLTGTISSGPKWSSAFNENCLECVDTSGRFLARYNPSKSTIPTIQLPSLKSSSHWQLIDAELSSSLGSFELPSSQPEEGYQPPRVPGKPIPLNEIKVSRLRSLGINELQVSSSRDTVSIRDSANGVWSWQRREIGSAIRTKSINRKGIAIAVATGNTIVNWDGSQISVIDLSQRPMKPRGIRRSPGAPIKQMVVASSGDKIAIIDANSKVTMFVEGQQSASRTMNETNCLAWISRGDATVVGTTEGDLVTINAQTGDELRREPAHLGPVTAVLELPNLNMFASVGEDLSLRLWDSLTGIQVKNNDLFLQDIATKLIYHEESQRLAAIGESSISLFVCRPGDVKRIHESTMSIKPDHAVYLPDGSRLFVSDGKTINILNAQDGRRLFTLPSMGSPIRCLGIDDGAPFALSEDGSVATWQTN